MQNTCVHYVGNINLADLILKIRTVTCTQSICETKH